MTLAEAYESYIKSRDGVLSPSTVAGYMRLRRNTFQRLMPMKLGNITSEQIQREISAMAKGGKAPKYIANAEGLLSSVLKQFNPGASYDLHLPPKRKPELQKLEDGDIAGVLAAFRGDPVELPVLMALWMGMRMSEILGAEFGDIDGGRLHIRRAVVIDADNNSVVKDSAKPTPEIGGSIFRPTSWLSSAPTAGTPGGSSPLPARPSTSALYGEWSGRDCRAAVSTTFVTPTPPSWCGSASIPSMRKSATAGRLTGCTSRSILTPWTIRWPRSVGRWTTILTTKCQQKFKKPINNNAYKLPSKGFDSPQLHQKGKPPDRNDQAVFPLFVRLCGSSRV